MLKNELYIQKRFHRKYTKLKGIKCSIFAYLLFVSSIVFVLIPAQAMAQEEFVPSPAKHLTSFSFKQLTGGIIILEATLDNFKDTLNFVLDTGSGGISLDSSTCSYFNLKKEMSSRIIRGIAGMRTVEFTYNHTLHFPGLTVERLDFHINDYDILTSVYGIKIDGIIGFSFLRRYIVQIDYDKMMLEVLTPGTIKYPKGGSLLKPQFSTLPMQFLQLKDARQIEGKYYFDTGAGLCMLLSQDLVEDSMLLKKKRKLFPTQAEGLGGKKSMNLTVIKEVKIGPYKFKRVPTYIFEDEYNLTSYPVLGGVIGNDLLRRFNVTLNYPEEQIFIKPNTHFQDSFDYSYTGLGIYLVDGAVTVVDIMKGSPAEKAGFETDDIIFGIDNNLSNNIQTYKVLLQNIKTTMSVYVLRKGKSITLKLYVRSIL